MNSFKFTNSKERNKIVLLTILMTVAAFLLFSNLNIGVNKSLVYFLASFTSFIYIMLYAKKAKKRIEDIIIKEDSIKLYFFNKMKDPISMNKNNSNVEVEGEEIKFKDMKTGNLIGVAKKKSIENLEEWDLLKNMLKKIYSENSSTIIP